MKKLIYLFILAIGFTSCSVESMDSTENLLTADMKIKIQQVDKSMTLLDSEICEEDAPSFVVNFPQNENGQGKTDVKIQIETSPGSGVWESFMDETYYDAGPKTITANNALAKGTYSYRASIGSGGFNYYATLNVVPCGCEESFSYVDNEDGSYTFTYIPAEDMLGAEVVFTFAQGVEVNGLDDSWSTNGVTRQSEMNLEACEEYSWTITLTANCSGKSGQSNVWTDFKVNDHSKKDHSEDKFTVNCN
ncbi:MAG TPA: hypothetical protein VLN46_02690 [Gillisia sp.]|nr:hypothetical protein [Gillisia sp.]